MAQPKKQSEYSRDHYIKIRVTEKERDTILNHAKEARMSTSQFCRTQILDKDVIIRYEVVADMKEIKNLAKEMNAIGNNLNQIARYFHEGGNDSVLLREEIHRAMNDLSKMKDELKKISEERHGIAEARNH